MGTVSRRVFIVDDDRSFGKSLKRFLDATGIPADCFESPARFFDAVPPDQEGIIVTDNCMPRCDGFEFMAKMHDLHYRMSVILMTGRTEEFTRDIALERGAKGFLKKPFNKESLLRLIEDLEQKQLSGTQTPPVA